MSITQGLQLPFGIQPVNPFPVDSWSGPYESASLQGAIDLANLTIPTEIRFQSMEVRLIVGGVSKKFWYRDGVANDNLIEFGLGPIGLTGATGIQGPTGSIGVTGPTGFGLQGATGFGVTSSFYLQGTYNYSYDTTSSIYRTGSLAIGTSASSTSKLYVYSTQSGAFRLEDGSQGENYILTSATSGVATWTSSAFVTAPISLTYSSLQNLVNTNGLELGRRYILTNYLHKYQILGSDSGAITQYHTMIGSLSGYAKFDNLPQNIAVGAIVTAISVPPSAVISVGQTFSVNTWYNQQYTILSGSGNSLSNVGTVYSFQKQRYPNVPTNTIIYDNYANIVMKKGGVINTDVHNGTAYMSMTGSENTAVQTEQLVLTAISENQFSTTAESLTYPGDIVDYRFDNSNILDEDGNSLGIQRNGFIIGRYNNELNISMNKDWRTQRYRRYKIDPENWTNLTLSGASSSTLYKIAGYNYGGVLNTSLNDGHKYLLRFPYESDFYSDFYSSTNTDPFKNGESSTPAINAAARISQDISNIYLKSITTNGLTYSNLKLAIDYPILPMNGHNPKSIINKAIIPEINNTVFKDLNQVYGLSRNFNIDINRISDSTVSTGCEIKSTSPITKLRSIDAFDITNYGSIDNLLITYSGVLSNNSDIVNCRFSGFLGPATNGFMTIKINNSFVYNSIFGTGRMDNIIISDCIINRSLFFIKYLTTSKITGNLYLTSINAHVDIHSTVFNFNNFNVQKQISSTQSKGLYGVKHTISSDVNNLQIDNYNPKLELVSKVLDINYGSLSYNIIGTTE